MNMEFQYLLAMILISLSSARLTRLLVSDNILEPFRAKFLDFDNIQEVFVPKNKLGYLIHCSWCSGLWITALNAACYFYIDWYFYVALVLSAAYIQGFLNTIEK